MDASTKIKEELKSMQSRIGELLTEFEAVQDRNDWVERDDEIHEWGVAHQGCEHSEITQYFNAPANSSIHNVLRRLSLEGRCVRVKQRRKNGSRTRQVWIYYFGEPMPKEPRKKQ